MGSPRSRMPKFQVKTVAQRQMRGSMLLGGNPQGCCKSDSGYSCVQHKYRAKNTKHKHVSNLAKETGSLRLED